MKEEEVWYMAHPLTADEKYTFQQNMDHVVHMMRICYEEGFTVVAPYHTICLALDNTNPEWRNIGIECDCNVIRKLKRLILVGHKLSEGMKHEINVCMNMPHSMTHVLVGHSDDSVRRLLRYIKHGGRD